MIHIRTTAAAAAAKMNNRVKGMKAALAKAMLKAVLYVHSQTPPYPPAPATSNYRRTGTLGRTVTTLMGQGPQALSRVESLFGNVTGFVGTSLEYAPWVIDEHRQARQHRGRWWTLQQVVEKAQDGIRKIFEQAMHALMH